MKKDPSQPTPHPARDSHVKSSSDTYIAKRYHNHKLKLYPSSFHWLFVPRENICSRLAYIQACSLHQKFTTTPYHSKNTLGSTDLVATRKSEVRYQHDIPF
jgi:hypothetical protein